MLTASLDRIGQDVGVAYHVWRRRGRGSRSSVWEAFSGDGERVAVKFLVCPDGLTASTLAWSLQALRQLAHPHIVHIDDVMGDLGNLVIIMELADGTLLDMLKRHQARFHQALPGELVCDYLEQAAEALDFLNGRQTNRDGHRCALQHGAIRPSNLLLFGDSLKLADCGPAWPVNVPLGLRNWDGPLHYAAPEVFRGRVSDWTDQYALAVSYCQLVGGRLPFNDTPRTCVRSYLRPTPDLSMLPEGERPIIARALAPVPSDRWPTCMDFLAELRAVQDAAAESLLPPF